MRLQPGERWRGNRPWYECGALKVICDYHYETCVSYHNHIRGMMMDYKSAREDGWYFLTTGRSPNSLACTQFSTGKFLTTPSRTSFPSACNILFHGNGERHTTAILIWWPLHHRLDTWNCHVREVKVWSFCHRLWSSSLRRCWSTQQAIITSNSEENHINHCKLTVFDHVVSLRRRARTWLPKASMLASAQRVWPLPMIYNRTEGTFTGMRLRPGERWRKGSRPWRMRNAHGASMEAVRSAVVPGQA